MNSTTRAVFGFALAGAYTLAQACEEGPHRRISGGYADGHPCFYIAPYVKNDTTVFVQDDSTTLAGPFRSEGAADSAVAAICKKRMKK
jgi:hypothetical protein